MGFGKRRAIFVSGLNSGLFGELSGWLSHWRLEEEKRVGKKATNKEPTRKTGDVTSTINPISTGFTEDAQWCCHVLKLERYREYQHGPCARMTPDTMKCPFFFCWVRLLKSVGVGFGFGKMAVFYCFCCCCCCCCCCYCCCCCCCYQKIKKEPK